MRRGVQTKPNSAHELEEDEHVIGIIYSLCSYCTGAQISRVLNKFVEHRYEKLERLVELHDKYIISSKKQAKTSQFKNIVYENVCIGSFRLIWMWTREITLRALNTAGPYAKWQI